MAGKNDKPLVWIIDAERAALGECLPSFDSCCSAFRYFEGGETLPLEEETPDVIVFSAEIAGGPGGEAFRRLRTEALGVPLLAAARVRSLAQAVAFFRAGANDYISLPLDPGELAERLEIARNARASTPPTVVVEVERIGSSAKTADTVTLDRVTALAPVNSAAKSAGEDEDILAELSREERSVAEADKTTVETPPSAASWRPVKAPPAAADPAGSSESGRSGGENRSRGGMAEDADPEPVDGLPIPSLWEELPCGLVVFDSMGNLVFSNALALELFGVETLSDLQEALETRRRSLNALGQNQKPLPDNQWPHVVAAKTKTPRFAVISVERSDKRRVWLRIDCLPHLTEGKVSRMSMTLVNMTGEMQPPADARGGGKGRKRRAD